MATFKPVKTGVVGCGNISGAYFAGMGRFGILDVAACADLDVDRARAKAAEWKIPQALSVAELLADPDIELVVNLTVPQAHVPVNLDIIAAGKNLHVEKPWAVNRDEGRKVLDAARARNLLCGCAPDTFLGGGIQTARKLLDDGLIGRPVAAVAFMACPGHESWHPSPEFYYQKGGGPLFDMGPYYLTALVNLLGPVRAVTAMARASFPTRTITSLPKRGTVVPVETPTHVAGTLEFAAGAIATLIMSFDVRAHTLPRIEIYGSDGTLSVPDPNTFGGSVQVRTAAMTEWVSMRLTHGNTDNMRGIGPADLAYALRAGRAPRASGALAYHVLDVMQTLLEAAEEGRCKAVASSCPRPAPLPVGLAPGELDG